jgi:hypothetical protein
VHPSLSIVQFESMAIAAECIRQNNVSTRIYKLLVQRHHSVWMIGNPKLGWLTRR